MLCVCCSGYSAGTWVVRACCDRTQWSIQISLSLSLSLSLSVCLSDSHRHRRSVNFYCLMSGVTSCGSTVQLHSGVEPRALASSARAACGGWSCWVVCLVSCGRVLTGGGAPWRVNWPCHVVPPPLTHSLNYSASLWHVSVCLRTRGVNLWGRGDTSPRIWSVKQK